MRRFKVERGQVMEKPWEGKRDASVHEQAFGWLLLHLALGIKFQRYILRH